MNKISFRLKKHTEKPNVEILEILLDGNMVATIYPDEKNPASVKLVSAHFAGELTKGNQFPEGIKMETAERLFPPIPGIHITFEPRRYKIQPGGIVRES
jgi:hypothetical protein